MTERSDRASDFESRAKRIFDDSVRSLDGHTRSQLAQARARALDAGSAGWRNRFDARAWFPAGAAAAAVLAALVVWQGPYMTENPIGSSVELAAFDDLDILLGDEELELYEELEFYAWLLEQPELQELLDASDSTG
jgi:hypothetical protein